MSYTVNEYLERVKSSDPTPGGGSVSALCGALASSLVIMVSSLSKSKKIYKENLSDDVKALYDSYLTELNNISLKLRELTDLDCEAYDLVSNAYKMDKADPERPAKIQESMKVAAKTPFETCKYILRGIEILDFYMDKTIKGAITDLGCAVSIFSSSFYGAGLNVKINLESIEDSEYVDNTLNELNSMEKKLKVHEQNILKVVSEKMKY